MAKMRFIATFDQNEHVVEVDDHGDEDGRYTMRLDGKDFEVDAQLMKSHIVSMLINHRSYDVDVEKLSPEPLDGRLGAMLRGRVIRFEMLDERRFKMKEAQSTRFDVGGASLISSPMPGKVIKLLANVGDSVEEGQGVVVVEAMKMENELRAPKAGTVSEVFANEGDAVEAGAKLMLIGD